MAPPTNKHPVEYSTAVLSLCLLLSTVNSVLLDALIKLNILTTGLLLTIKFAADGISAMGLKKANIYIGEIGL